MNLNSKLKQLKHDTELNRAVAQVEEITKEMVKSVKQGYQGKVFGFYISPLLGTLLTKEGLCWKTFTDGEFEESSIWIG